FRYINHRTTCIRALDYVAYCCAVFSNPQSSILNPNPKGVA
ncbi:MAG: hypothetical protein ACI9T8_000633, partial [Candidatus Saccharimonadales bacterium]